MKLLVLPLLALLASCATDIDFKIPSHRFMDPETRGSDIFKGEWDGYIQTSYQTDHKLTMTEVYDYGVFGSRVDEGQALERTTNLGWQFAVGLVPMLDISYRRNGDSPGMLIGKVQLYGESFKEKKDGLKFAAWAGVGGMSEDEGTLTVASNNQTRSYNGKIDVTASEVGASIGYRFDSWIIAYFNGTYAVYESESVLTSNVHPTVNVKGDAKLEAAVFGIKFGGQDASMHLEVGASRVTWDKDIKLEQEIGTGAVALTVEF